MSEKSRPRQEGVCWPERGVTHYGFTTTTKRRGIPVLSCTQLATDNTCALLRTPCEFLPPSQKNILSCEADAGRLTLNTLTGRVTGPKGTAQLTTSEQMLLAALMQTPGEILTHRALYGILNPNHDFEIPRAATSKNTINVHISRLRGKLGDEVPKRRGSDKLLSGNQLIGTAFNHTAREGGYYLIMPDDHHEN